MDQLDLSVVLLEAPLLIIRAWVGVEMAEVQGVHELGVDLEGVGSQKGVCERVA